MCVVAARGNNKTEVKGMENKETNFKWKPKNNSVIFGLCLVGVAAFSALFAMSQVQQAEKEKDPVEIQNEAGSASFVPQVDEAIQNALDQAQNGLTTAQSLEEGFEESAQAASNEITAEMNGEEVPAEDALADQDTDSAVEAQSNVIMPTVSFLDTDSLNWPVAGSVVLDYSMDGSIYFPTLQQYKYNPALVIGSDVGAQVVAAAKGIVESIRIDEETGTTVVMSLGNGYKLKYGQLKELNVAEGDVVEQGQLIGYVSEPTKYYCVEGSNLYFAMTKDEVPVDPVLYLE